MADIERITVTRAIIERDGKILAAKRNRHMSFAMQWEFPGGKVEEGEGFVECVTRELKEELDTEIMVKSTLPTYIHNRGLKTIEIIPFVCRINKGIPKCLEHEAIIWDEPSDLAGLDWTEADYAIYKEYLNHLENCKNQKN